MVHIHVETEFEKKRSWNWFVLYHTECWSCQEFCVKILVILKSFHDCWLVVRFHDFLTLSLEAQHCFENNTSKKTPCFKGLHHVGSSLLEQLENMLPRSLVNKVQKCFDITEIKFQTFTSTSKCYSLPVALFSYKRLHFV